MLVAVLRPDLFSPRCTRPVSLTAYSLLVRSLLLLVSLQLAAYSSSLLGDICRPCLKTKRQNTHRARPPARVVAVGAMNFELALGVGHDTAPTANPTHCLA